MNSEWPYEATHQGHTSFWLTSLDTSLRDQKVLRPNGRLGLGMWSCGAWGMRVFCQPCGQTQSSVTQFHFRRTLKTPPALRGRRKAVRKAKEKPA